MTTTTITTSTSKKEEETRLLGVLLLVAFQDRVYSHMLNLLYAYTSFSLRSLGFRKKSMHYDNDCLSTSDVCSKLRIFTQYVPILLEWIRHPTHSSTALISPNPRESSAEGAQRSPIVVLY
jgi:hypothetical protein